MLRLWGGKGVMRKNIFFFIFIVLKKWKIRYPRESHFIGIIFIFPKIKFIRPKFFHSLRVAKNRKRFLGNFFTERFRNVNHQPFNNRPNILFISKRHFHIYLSMFKLSVSTK